MSLGESPSTRTSIRRRIARRVAGTAAVAVAVSAIAVATVVSAPAATAATPIAPLGIAAGGILPYASQADRNAYFAAARDLGATWLRFDMTWNDIQRTNTTNFDWARYDTVVADAQRYGLQVVGLIGYAPKWAQDPACAGNNVCRPRSAEEYGTFAGAVAAHYGPKGVHHWEIWNEPNVPQFFAPAPNAAQYTAMLKSAHTRIHAADSKAQVLAAGPAPAATGGGTISPIDFLNGIYANGGAGSFDIMGTHPYCYAGSFNCPGKDETWSAWTQMSKTKTSIRSVMSAHGDGQKRVWATEFGAPTNGNQATSETQQAQMIVDGLKMFGESTWSGPLFVYSLKDRGTNPGDREDWFGILRADGSRKPAYAQVRNLVLNSAQRPIGGGGTGTTPDPKPTVTRDPAPAPTPTPAPTATPPPVSTGGSWWEWILRWFR